MNNPYPPTYVLPWPDGSSRLSLNPLYVAWQKGYEAGYEARGEDVEAAYDQGREDVANKSHEH